MNILNFVKKYYFELTVPVLILILYSNSIHSWLEEWSNWDSFYSFGFFVLIFIGYIIKKNLVYLKNIPKQSCWHGLPVIAVGMIFYIIGLRADYSYFTNISLPLLLSGLILLAYGNNVLKKMIFPLILLTFSLPICPLHRITIPMQLFSASTTSKILNFLDIKSIHEGAVLYVDRVRVLVAPACSGLRSLSSLFFTSLIFSYFTNCKKCIKIILVLLSLPFAVFMNINRLLIVSFYALYNGAKGLMEFHDMVGFVLYIVSISIMILTFRLVDSNLEKHKNEV